MTEEDEMKFTNVEIAYENYVISLMQGKTAEQVDDTEFTLDQIERAGHYARQIRMFGKLDPDELEQNYLEEVVKNGPDVRQFEAEIEYRKKYGEDPMPDPSKPCVDRPCQCDEYDGRDDDFIQEILKYMKIQDRQETDDDVQLSLDEKFSKTKQEYKRVRYDRPRTRT